MVRLSTPHGQHAELPTREDGEVTDEHAAGQWLWP
jgi:hypothetical protein